MHLLPLLRDLRLVALITSFTISLAAQGPASTTDIVYVLAGQSNIELLATPATPPTTCGTGAPQTNVLYYGNAGNPPQLTIGIPNPPYPPLLELGTILSQHHPSAQVHIVMLAVSGSALLRRNDFQNVGYWVDSSNPVGGTGALVHRYSNLMTQLQFADELHIVWGQGETDAAAASATNPPTTGGEYSFWAQQVLAGLAAAAGHLTSYRVHLVTVGAIELQSQNNANANAIRDAYMNMDRSPMSFAGYTPPIDTVAHHYDQQKRPNDPYHLTQCGYVTLGARIGNGIRNQVSQPRLVSLAPSALVITGNDLTMLVNTNLVTLPLGTRARNYFEVRVNNQPVTQFQVGASGQTLTVRLPSAPIGTVTVRYVAGSGYGLRWAPIAPALAPLRAATNNAPLEPFFISS